MNLAPMPLPTEPPVASNPITEALGNIISVVLYPLAFFAFVFVVGLVLWLWVAVLEKIASHRNPSNVRLSTYDIQKRYEARKGSTAKRTVQILNEADGYEYTRLFAQEASGTKGVTARLDELENIAMATLRSRDTSS